MSSDGPSISNLPPAALAASRAALNAALSDPTTSASLTINTTSLAPESAGPTEGNSLNAVPEPGEIQELEASIAGIEEARTVFSDPTSFNVKVRAIGRLNLGEDSACVFAASTLFCVDSVV